jgi:hypothetical protein
MFAHVAAERAGGVKWRSEGYEAVNAGRSSKRDEFFWPPRKDIRNAAVMVGVGGDACIAADVARVRDSSSAVTTGP